MTTELEKAHSEVKRLEAFGHGVSCGARKGSCNLCRARERVREFEKRKARER